MLKITILGNNSATPAFGRHTTSQILQNDSESFMIDCGEGTQLQMQKYGIRASKLNHIFISHLHGDHFLGLVGLLATMSLHGRKDALFIYAHKPLSDFIRLSFKLSHTILNYDLKFVNIIPEKRQLLYENNTIEVFAFPLKHRIDCAGFLFKEKKRKKRNVISQKLPQDMSPLFIKRMREGENILDTEGNILYDYTEFTEVYQPKSYAYCSDTLYYEGIVPFIQGTTLLYHESTFLTTETERAKQTFHSTAQEAAKIADLAQVKQLLLGHFSSRYRDLTPFLDEARIIFTATDLSVEGQTWEIL